MAGKSPRERATQKWVPKVSPGSSGLGRVWRGLAGSGASIPDPPQSKGCSCCFTPWLQQLDLLFFSENSEQCEGTGWHNIFSIPITRFFIIARYMNEDLNKGNAHQRHYSCIYQNGVPTLCCSPLLTPKPKLLGVEEESCHNMVYPLFPLCPHSVPSTNTRLHATFYSYRDSFITLSMPLYMPFPSPRKSPASLMCWVIPFFQMNQPSVPTFLQLPLTSL